MKRCPKCFGFIRRMGHIEKPFYCPECKEWFSNEEVTPKLTNADRIRTMTNEELADVFAMISDCISCNCRNAEDDCSIVDGTCQRQWLEWLKQKGE